MTASGPMADWTDQVLRHVRTRRHQRWSARLEVGQTVTILVPSMPDLSRTAAPLSDSTVARSTAPTSTTPSVERVA